MVDITPLIPHGKQVIESYGDGGFKISGKRYQGSVIIFPSFTIEWKIKNPQELSHDDFSEIIKNSNELNILLLGMGKTAQFLRPEIRLSLKQRNIVVDAMDTGAACRTYNVLLAEERRIAAALIAV